jgi:cyanophycin synthetase
MEILNCRLLRGRNRWAPFAVLEALVDVRPLKPPAFAGFNERLTQWLPVMADQRRRMEERIAFVDRWRDGGFQAQSLQYVAVELQSSAGAPVHFGQVRPTSMEGVYQLALEYDDDVLARACLQSARNICVAAADGKEFDVPAEIRRLRELGDESRLGPSTRSIVEAAKKRAIPAILLSEGNLVQLGYGARQRRICAAETDRTSALGETVAQDKELTRLLLRKIGVPFRWGVRQSAPRRPGKLPASSGCQWSSSRATAIMDGAWPPILGRGARSSRLMKPRSSKARRLSSSSSYVEPITACW